MGWTFGQQTRRELIAELTPAERRDANGRIFRTLKHCCRGNVLYAVHESTPAEGPSRKWIGLYLLQRDGDLWGYKDMDETMGPYYYHCPLSYLDLADAPANEYAAEWRAIVRQEAAKKAAQQAKKPQPGETWGLVNCRIPHVRIRSVKPLRGSYQGSTYKLKKKQLGEQLFD